MATMNEPVSPYVFIEKCENKIIKVRIWNNFRHYGLHKNSIKIWSAYTHIWTEPGKGHAGFYFLKLFEQDDNLTN